MGIGGILCDFCQDTTCHALDRVGDPERKRCARVIWFFIFLAAFGLLTRQYYYIITRYLSYDVIVDTSLDFSELPFPAITVCNLNLVPVSKIPQNSSLEDLNKLYIALLTSNLKKQSVRDRVCKSQKHKDVALLCATLVNESVSLYSGSNGSTLLPEKPILYWQSQFELVLPVFLAENEKELSKLATTAEDMVLDCVLNGEECMSRVKGTFDYENGMCFTVAPHIGFKVKDDGPSNGLSLLIDINVNDYLPSTDVVGVRVFVHTHDKDYRLENSGFYAAVGTRTAFAVRMITTSRLGPPYGDCTSSDEPGPTDDYYFYGKYTINGCMKSCMQKKIIEQCNCSMAGYGVPLDYQGKYCWKNTLVCAMKIFQEVTGNSEWTKDACGCPVPCETTDYTHTVSSAVWPPPMSVDSMYCISSKGSSCDPSNASDYYAANTLVLEIYYDSLNYNKYEEREDYEISDMFSDFGAYLGLLLGASMCTCMEVVSLVITICLFCCRLTKKNNFELKDSTEEKKRIDSALQTSNCNPHETILANTPCPYIQNTGPL